MTFLKRILYSLCTTCRPHKSRTVRFAFPVAFATLVILGATAISSTENSYIKLTTTDNEITTGEFFTIDVLVNAHVEVNAIDIQVSFPEDQIEVDGIDVGESVITIWTEDPYVEAGTVHLSGGTFRRGFIGEHVVAQINARAKTNGSAKFAIADARILAGDGQGSTVSVSETGEETLTMFVAVTESATGDERSISGEATVGIFTDTNGDGQVNMNDVTSFMSAWRNGSRVYDFNNDGKMTFVDFAIILADSFLR